MTHRAPDPALEAGTAFVTQKSNLTVAQLLLEYLKLEGATTMFGIPGGALIYLINELKARRGEFSFVICRHETGAAYIAHGYSLVSGQLGVVLTTSGPAATNALTGMMNAQAANCSLLTISGEVPQQFFGEGYLQEGIDAKLDVATVYRNAVEYSTVISTQANFGTLFRQALRVARSQPPRAAHVSLPNDVAGTCVTGDDPSQPYRIAFPRSPDQYRAIPSGTDPAKTRLTFDELAAATRPLVFLGNGARHALADSGRRARFAEWVEKFAIPVMTTPDAKGIFPETHPLALRSYGMTACTWPDAYIRPPADPDHYDALLVLGSTLGELATTVVAKDHYSKNLIPREHFIQVDLDQGMIGRDFPITRGIVGDVGATIDVLCGLGAERQPDRARVDARRRVVEDIRKQSPFSDPKGRASDSAPIHPAALVRVLNDTVRSGHLFIDAGNCVGWSLNNMVVDPPLHYHSALGMGPMGFAVGAVVGGKIGAPDLPCIGLVGDGAFMMHGAEISTAAQYRVGAVWIVLFDNDLAMVSQGMAALFPPPQPWADYYALGAPDLVKFSEGLGAQAVAIGRDQGPAAFGAALQTALRQADEQKRPQVIVVHVDTVPMPPYGWPVVPPPPCAPPPGKARS
jgi:acetolactate synthase I/II/III large subunit